MRLLVSCGEPSGDLYAAELVRHLRQSVATLDVFGLGGDRLAAEGASLVAHVRDLAVVGLVEVLRHLQRLRRTFRSVLGEVDRRRPDAAVLVDYPDFHLRLARELRRRGVPVVYYVSPQVWAWRPGRVRTIRDTVTRMIVIFPFEEALYREAGVDVRFVGHPLVELVQPPSDREAFLAAHGLDPSRPLLLVMPGSRPQEVAHNLPPLAGALRLVAARRGGVQLALAVAPSLPPSLFDDATAGLGLLRLAGHTHQLMGSATAGIVASGTATVEAALLDLPMVVVYRLSALTYVLGRPFVRVPHYAMANLIAGREVVKELIQKDFRPETVAAEALRLLEDGSRRAEVRRGLAEVRARLGEPGASARAAAEVQEVVAKSKKS
ncbi:MAG TPA: lipid-A-disaccharide synthase [Vicinamibacteria bacterium]|nr:lipid-A-disaccharide synthase [Vicinamibacteria bacterium]